MSINPPKNNSNSDGRISRRTFLKYMGAAGAVFTLSYLVPFSKTFGTAANSTNATTSNVFRSNTSLLSSRSPHTFNLDAATPQFLNAAGSQTIANADNFPILSDWAMSAFLVRLNKGGVLEPHWHPNAAELGYCISGRAEMTIYPDAARDADSFTVHTFTIDPGEIVFVPQGFTHDIENISNEEAKFVIAYNIERPTTIGLSGSVGSMPNRVMDKTFGIKSPMRFFNGFNKNSPKDIITGSKPANVPEPGYSIPKITDSYKFNIEGIPPQIQTNAGTVAKTYTNIFPVLSGSKLALFSLIMKPNGIREPHWHPNCSELGYVLECQQRHTQRPNNLFIFIHP